MNRARAGTGLPLLSAMVVAVLIGGQYIAGKAARDALFLAAFDPAVLPRVIVGTALFSAMLAVTAGRLLRGISPVRWVPMALVASGTLYAGEWALARRVPEVAASLLYLQVSGVGPFLGSGFWLIISEQFDPRTAKKNFGAIAGAGTFGGLIGGLVAARVAVVTNIESILPMLAVLNGACAWQVASMSRAPSTAAPRSSKPSQGLSSGVGVLAREPFLQNLALLVLLGAIAAVPVDYAFKAQAKSTLGSGPELASFFSVYYAVLSVATFGVQTLTAKAALERLGLAACASTPAVTLAVGGVASLAAPGFTSLVVTRAGEAIGRGSLHRAGYELFFAPVASDERRAVKSVIDVGVDRSGDILGASLVQGLLLLPASRQFTAMMGVSILASLLALVVARRLTRGYVSTLERSLLNRAVDLDLSDAEDSTTRTVILQTLQLPSLSAGTIGTADAASTRNPDIANVATLQSGDAVRIARFLRNQRDFPPTLVAHVIPLLAVDLVAADAIRSLQRVADMRVGALTDALVDPKQPFAVRRRLPRVFSACTSQRGVDGLLLGLDDLRFEVRYHTGRALAAIKARHANLRIDSARVYASVLREITVNRPVWEGRRIVDSDDSMSQSLPGLEEVLITRTNQSLSHVFILLSLVLPSAPIRIAYKALHTSDPVFEGTALEYLESVLPGTIREALWPFLEATPARGPTRPPAQIVADLLNANDSITMKLKDWEPASRHT